VQGANIDIARRAFAGLSGEGDVAAGFALLAEDVEVHDHDIPDAEVYRGGAGVIEWGALDYYNDQPEALAAAGVER